MLKTKRSLEKRLPFAMDPVVYDFEINDRGTWGELCTNKVIGMPQEYYALMIPNWIQQDQQSLTLGCRQELEALGSDFRSAGNSESYQKLLEGILPGRKPDADKAETLNETLKRIGFDRTQHEQVRSDLRSGRYGLAQNRLPLNTSITDVNPNDVVDTRSGVDSQLTTLGENAIANGQVAVVTLAAGVGSRWTEGAGVSKGLHPFCQMGGRHRSFLEVHLSKSKQTGKEFGCHFPHVITTGYMTDAAIQEHLATNNNYDHPGEVLVSPGKYIGLRMIPMVRDLQFEWEEVSQQILDEQKQKMRDSVRSALIGWARQMGEGSDYLDNAPNQCLHPVGHWYEVPNMLRNGVLHGMLEQNSSLKYLMLHNVDTLGANVDPGMLGLHIESGRCLSFEVISRRLEDRGGGLARVNGRPRLLEGLSMPREEDEFKLSYYNSMTTWIDIDQLLDVFGLSRDDLSDSKTVDAAIRDLSQSMPTYITIKDVKKRWGHGQEDIYPVSQFEKLWSDMSGLSEISTNFVVVPRARGQQLKEQAQLDSWLRDGSASYVDSLCDWE